MGRLENKVAIITGGAKGLGEADARLFAQEGATVIITDVDAENGERVAKEIGGKAEYMHLDVRYAHEWETLIYKVVKKHGGLHILVNNAGVVEVGTIESQTEEDYRFVMAVSADGTFFGCKYAVPAMQKSGGGSIINMASIASLQGEEYVVAYCAAKGAVESLTRSVAVHCGRGKTNIRCNSVHPAGIVTPMVMGMPEKVEKAGLMESMTEQSTSVTVNALGEPNDIAYTVLFLASDESKFINGAAIRVDNAISATAGLI